MNGIIGSPIGINSVIGKTPPPMRKQQEKSEKNDEITKIVTHSADKSGCAHYRMIWPSYVLNSTKEYIISDFKRVVINDEWYRGVDVIRIQRQVSNAQYKLFQHLRRISDKHGIRLVYELDDIPFYEDIPLYNKNRSSYANKEHRQNIENMMNASDEVTVSTKFMKEYFLNKLKTDKITHVPNYIPRFWMDRYYDEEKLKINFSKHKKKPRILYAGSASHYSMDGSVEDDFTKLVDYVKKTLKDYQWAFFGGLPRPLIPLWKSGHIEFHNYAHVVSYPEVFKSLNVNISIAPLLKNNFNRAKSHIKLTESAAYGIPCICQSGIETYDDLSMYTFDTAAELDDQIKSLTKDSNSYMKACRKSRMICDKFWLEDNIDVWDELYRLPFGSDKREKLNKINV